MRPYYKTIFPFLFLAFALAGCCCCEKSLNEQAEQAQRLSLGVCQPTPALKRLYDALDKAGKGYLQARDLRNFLDTLVSWYVPSRATKEISEATIEYLDFDGDGQITLNEAAAAFKNNIPKEIKHDQLPRQIDVGKALVIMRRFDANNNDVLDPAELDAFLDELVLKGVPSVAKKQAKKILTEIIDLLANTKQKQNLGVVDVLAILKDIQTTILSDNKCAPNSSKSLSFRSFTSLDAAINIAKKEQKPLFAIFTAGWCSPCREFENETLYNPDIASLLSGFILVKVDTDKPEIRPIIERYGVRQIPTVLMISTEGKELERVTGFYPPRFFRPPLEAALNGTSRPLIAAAQTTPTKETPEIPGSLSEKPLRKRPPEQTSQLNLANRYLLHFKISEAKNLYKLVLYSDPGNALGYGAAGLFGLIRVLFREAKYKDALQEIQSFYTRFPDSLLRIDVHRFEIASLDKLGNLEGYKQTLLSFRERFPSEPIEFLTHPASAKPLSNKHILP